MPITKKGANLLLHWLFSGRDENKAVVIYKLRDEEDFRSFYDAVDLTCGSGKILVRFMLPIIKYNGGEYIR